ncbi:hypothetical protein QZH36_08485 [Erwinia sp. BC051422]|uniref:hypothetical protein n=1 Tax=Erwinia wuhanensis TaxID=3045167 RepID=UPI0026555219|nr:hypothetical protein [Erwinia sp. BC051422]MDN8541474.1 hypothetical protein [Erwinia sp. BC051422]
MIRPFFVKIPVPDRLVWKISGRTVLFKPEGLATQNEISERNNNYCQANAITHRLTNDLLVFFSIKVKIDSLKLSKVDFAP